MVTDERSDSYNQGHRDARMAIDSLLADAGRGSIADLSGAIRALQRRASAGHAFTPGTGLMQPHKCDATVATPHGPRKCGIPLAGHAAPRKSLAHRILSGLRGGK